ncbi:MAG: mechanosensitive ion channel family protein [Acidimicrobiales bacterium]
MLAQQSFDWRGPLESTLGTITDFIPRFLLFLVVLLVGFWVARWIRRGVTAGLSRLRFDHYIDRSGLGEPLARAGYADSGRLLAQLVYYLIALLVLQMAFNVFGPNPITDALNGLVAWMPKLVVAVILVIIGGLVANVVRQVVAGATAGQSFGSLVTRGAVAAVWVFFGLAALDQIDIGRDVIDALTTAIFASLTGVLVIMFGVGGVWAARDRFWPSVFDSVSSGARRATGPVAGSQVPGTAAAGGPSDDLPPMPPQ